MSGLSGEDQARVEGVIRDYLNAYGFGSPTYENAMALTRALALIDQQEADLRDTGKALEAAIRLNEKRLALLDHANLVVIPRLEKALEAADEAVGYMDSALYALTQPFAGDPHTAAVGALEVGLDIYRSARATSTKEDG